MSLEALIQTIGMPVAPQEWRLGEMTIRIRLLGVIVLAGTFSGLLLSQVPGSLEDHVAVYANTKPTDAIARLQEKIAAGAVKLDFDPHWGYLPALLNQLSIPTSSQTLVFSKTSVQFTQIFPDRPRALYFNDEVYVGYVQGSEMLEIASVDPKLGAVFYTVAQDQDHALPVEFHREVTVCLLCHESGTITGGVPGFMMLSVLPDRDGNAIPSAGSIAVTDQTPLNERWGGWYVTGTHGNQLHRGNTIVPLTVDGVGNGKAYAARMDLSKGANVTSLQGRIDTKPYLTKDSDIVALMVLSHQTRIHNLITRGNAEVLAALHDEEVAYKGLARPGARYSPITAEHIKSAMEPLVRAMFFAYETDLTSPISGTTSFASDFQKQGPHDRQGRSLRDLDLNRRLLKYPLSYLIYSEAFDALPAAGKDYFYERVRDILSGDDTSGAFAHLSVTDRKAIKEILTDTKTEFAAAIQK
jgi:hypothetical protein